jgi:hypothetical protein
MRITCGSVIVVLDRFELHAEVIEQPVLQEFSPSAHTSDRPTDRGRA